MKITIKQTEIMEVKVLQNWKGRYNLLSKEETLSFTMAIIGEDKKPIEVNGVKAILYLNEDREPFDSPLDEVENIFEECFDYSNRVWSTVNYTAQCLLFAKIYQENFDLLRQNRIEKQKVEIANEIQRLEQRLKNLYGFDDISWKANNKINSKIKTFQGLIETNQKELEQIKDGTEKFDAISKRISEYQSQIDFYESSKVQESN